MRCYKVPGGHHLHVFNSGCASWWPSSSEDGHLVTHLPGDIIINVESE